MTTTLAETLCSLDGAGRVADDDLTYEAGLVATELLSNAARACRSRLLVRVDIHCDHIRIAVHDDGPGVPVERTADAADVGGRGLRIVDSLSTRWGTGSTLLLYTDGLVERPGTDLDSGIDDLARIVAGHDPADGPDALCDRILRTVDRPGRDDVALLAIHVNGPDRP